MSEDRASPPTGAADEGHLPAAATRVLGRNDRDSPDVPHDEKPSPAFIALHITTLRLDSVVPFDLYVLVNDAYVLYRERSLPFSDGNVQALLENNVSTLYVEEASSFYLHAYLEERLGSILRDKHVPGEARADIAVMVAQSVARDIMQAPESFMADRTLRVARSMASFVTKASGAARHLMGAIRDGSSLAAHSANTAVYAALLAAIAPYPKLQAVESLATAGLLHDIGLAFAPPEILDKPGPLTDDERRIIELHPVTGEQLLRQTASLPEDLLRAIRYHHERLDGTGYPNGFKGWTIPWMARALAFAEVFDSLTSTQPWRKRMTPLAALHLMHKEMRHGLDSDIIREFIPLLQAEPEAEAE